MRPCWLVIALVLAPAIGAADAPSQAGRRHLKNPDADAHLQLGLDAYAAKNWKIASKEFSTANSLEPTPSLLYGWAQAERFDGNCPQAVALYRKYLDTESLDPEVANAARSFIRECSSSMALPPDAAPVRPTPWYEDRLLDGLAISGVLGVFVGIGYLSAASSSQDRADHAIHLDEFRQAREDFSHERTVGGTALTLGLGALGGSVFVYMTRYRGHKTESVVTTDGHSVIYAATF